MSVTVLAIDWSGALNPRGKLWLAEANHREFRGVWPFSSREALVDYVLEYCGRNPRTIVGIDFAFSFPTWFIDELQAASAEQIWHNAGELGEDWLRNCEPPFWGRKGKRKPDLPGHFRETELRLDGVRGIRAKSVFQICGAGAVGTGSIRGMPWLLKLAQGGLSIWPFHHPRLPMVIEIYPRVLTGPVNKGDASARAEYLHRHCRAIASAHRSQIAHSEDSFDAGVSALIMAQESKWLESPGPSRSASLEGEIWRPAPSLTVLRT